MVTMWPVWLPGGRTLVYSTLPSARTTRYTAPRRTVSAVGWVTPGTRAAAVDVSTAAGATATTALARPDSVAAPVAFTREARRACTDPSRRASDRTPPCTRLSATGSAPSASRLRAVVVTAPVASVRLVRRTVASLVRTGAWASKPLIFRHWRKPAVVVL